MVSKIEYIIALFSPIKNILKLCHFPTDREKLLPQLKLNILLRFLISENLIQKWHLSFIRHWKMFRNILLSFRPSCNNCHYFCKWFVLEIATSLKLYNVLQLTSAVGPFSLHINHLLKSNIMAEVVSGKR